MKEDCIALLKELIAVPSVSRDEKAAADLLEHRLKERGLDVNRTGNNLWICDSEEDGRPTVLLNAHIDTVKPSDAWTRDPFTPVIEDGRLYGLGSNDDGGSLVALLKAYEELSGKRQPYRLIYSVTAEEEVSGRGGIDMLLPEIGKIDFGVIGEPTGMALAVAERGLMVLDCESLGRSGHAAREEGVNAIYEALGDLEWFHSYRFERNSEFLGAVKMSVTQINAGTQHNVIPDKCTFVVDVRPNGMYSNLEVLQIIKNSVKCQVKERSTRINSSSIDISHPAVRRGMEIGLKTFGSPTTSNQSLVSFPTVKIGPGDSARSHSADEFIRPSEIEEGIKTYVKLLDGLELQ